MSAPRGDRVIELKTALPLRARSPSRRTPKASVSDARPAIVWHPAGASEPENPSLSPLRLVIRGAGLRDLLSLLRVSSVLPLNQPEINLVPYRPASVVIDRLAPWRRPRGRMFVACAGDRLVGFAHWQPVLPDRRWQLIALGSSTGVYDTVPVWEELIRHGTTVAGLSGVKRLYARVPVTSPAAELLRSLGFTAYASETVFLAHDVRGGTVSLPLRLQEVGDTWAIHQLYNASVPRQVQYAEAWTSHRWDVRSSSEIKGVVTRGWLIEDQHHVQGYVRVSSRASTHVLELIYVPEQGHVIGELLDGVIGRLRAQSRVERVYCALRGYQEEAVAALEARGFAPLLEQDLYVKYTTANAWVTQVDPVPLHTEVIERLPKRAPSFLHGAAGDETVR